jgi:hypothetical protein
MAHVHSRIWTLALSAAACVPCRAEPRGCQVGRACCKLLGGGGGQTGQRVLLETRQWR